jgi:hypothetical protein
MAIRVFYSWQSDRRQNRNFIRSALDAAVKELRQELALEEAERDIVVDQDTQGLPGSPAIADAILTKIRRTDVFVADLTFIDDIESNDTKDRRTPNPNVMLEYGYALHALGDSRIVGVFNEAYGPARQLPFDLAHRRWPIRFKIAEGGSDNKKTEKQRLTASLKQALQSVISQFEDSNQPRGAAEPFQAREPGDGLGRLRHQQDYLCLSSANDAKPIWLKQGPYAFLRLMPTIALPELGEVEAYKIAQANLQPMAGMRGGGWSMGRHHSGAVVYSAASDNPEIAWDASQLFLSQELWSNDFFHVNRERDLIKDLGFPYIPTGAVEEVFIDTLINFMQVSRTDLRIPLPVRIVTGLAGVNGFRLAVDPRYFAYHDYVGNILKETIIVETTLGDWSVDPFDFLFPFFKKIYDAAGVVRPNIRTIGRRQR